MSFLLWIDEEADDAIDLGDPFLLFKGFGEMGSLVDGDDGLSELFSVPEYGEQNVEEEWLVNVREQATSFLEQYKVSDHTRWILEQLAGENGKAETVRR